MSVDPATVERLRRRRGRPVVTSCYLRLAGSAGPVLVSEAQFARLRELAEEQLGEASLDRRVRLAVRRDLARIEARLGSRRWPPDTRGIAAFSCAALDWVEVVAMPFAVVDQVSIRPSPDVGQLASGIAYAADLLVGEARRRLALALEPSRLLDATVGPSSLAEQVAHRRDERVRARLGAAIHGGREPAVVGLEAVLEALNTESIALLVVTEGLRVRGRRCRRCGWLGSGDEFRSCPACGGRLSPLDDVLAYAASEIVAAGGEVVELRRSSLSRLGAVAAVLR